MRTQQNKRKKRKEIYTGLFKALAKEGYHGDSEKLWERSLGPAKVLQENIQQGIKSAMGTPLREIDASILHRGRKKLVTEIEAGPLRSTRKQVGEILGKIGINISSKEKRLYDYLDIEKKKAELSLLREKGNIKNISAKELEIAKEIQGAISRFPYKLTAYSPKEMRVEQKMNCLGSAILGGSMLEEVGIKYLVGNLPGHVVTILLTTDGKKYWQEFTPGSYKMKNNYFEIKQDMLEGDIAFNVKKGSGQKITFKNLRYRSGKLSLWTYPPDIGIQQIFYNNLGGDFSDLYRREEAIGMYEKALDINPNHEYLYNNFYVIFQI